MKLYFLADAIMGNEVVHAKGEIKEVPDKGGHSMKWIRRGVAIPHKDYLADQEKAKKSLDQPTAQVEQPQQSLELKGKQKEDIQEAPQSGNPRGGSKNSSKNKTQGSELL